MIKSAVTGQAPDMDWSDLALADDIETLPVLPGWVAAARGEAIENIAFLSVAALAHLHLVLACKKMPQSLLRDRLALQAAAEVCMVVSGRPERTGELHDALHLQRGGSGSWFLRMVFKWATSATTGAFPKTAVS